MRSRAGDQVFDPAGRDRRASGRHAQRHGVDREVAAREVALERVAELDGGLAGDPVVAVGPVGRDLDLLGRPMRRGDLGADRAECPPDVPVRGADGLDDPQDLVGQRVGREVQVVGLTAEERVAHRTPDDREIVPRASEGVGEGRHDRRRGKRTQALHALGHVEHAPSLSSDFRGSGCARGQAKRRNPVNTSSRTRGSRSSRRAAASTSRSSRDRVDQHTHAQVAVARADERGETRVDGERPTEPAALPQLDDRRIRRTGQVVTRLGDVGCDDEDGCREPRVIESLEPIVRGEGVGEVRAQPVSGERLRQRLVPRQSRRHRGRPPQQDVAEPDLAHLPRGEVVQPRVDERRERRRAGQRSAVAHPEFGIRERDRCCSRSTTHASSGTGELGHPLRARARVRRRRGGSPSCRAAVRRRRVRGAAPTPSDECRDEVVADEPAVAVLIGGHARRRVA